MSDLYQEIIIEEYQHPHNQGELSNADTKWHERNSSCGDEVTVYLKFDEAHQQIADISWTGQGCAISISAMSFLSEAVKKKTLTQVLALTKPDLEAMMGIEEIMYGREKCLLLGLTAIQHALTAKKA